MTAQAIKTTLRDLTLALRGAWAADTSAAPDWSAATPSRGQCAVTALVVQDELGGVLLRAVVEGQSHYWNRLPDGSEVDLTRSQFASFAPVGTKVADRGYVLSFPDTDRRYELLRSRVTDRLR